MTSSTTNSELHYARAGGVGSIGVIDAPDSCIDVSASRTLAELFHNTPGRRTAVILPDTGIRITYDQLHEQVMTMAGALRALGIEHGDRVATVLPNGLPALVSFLAASIAGTAAPLNSGYRQDEFGFYLDDTSAKVLLCPPDGAAEARKAALGKVPVHSIDINADGHVRIVDAPAHVRTFSPDPPDPHDVALVLHTSGSTGRPKRVPIRHRNIVASARNIVAHYALTPDDVALVAMPLFHVHGLIASVVSTLLSGGTIVVPSKFQPATFWQTIRDCGVTWYSAVPTIHHTLLSRAGGERPTGAEGLRFIRSCSAPLAPETMAKMEQVFGVPVLEAYGMTEAAHQMASNPRPPAVRKPGSVGLGTNVNIGIMDAQGGLLATGERGEVVIRGPSVVDGYENNPEANAASFTNGWFRTGDQGFLDGEGYLTLTGRIKELINRGGEKIAPREIDEVLLTHPAVAEAVAFGVPHPSWGEDVAAAIVLRDNLAGSEQLEKELREFCAARLAHFKVPRRIVFVAETPKGATGKTLRIGMAEKLGLTAPATNKDAAARVPKAPGRVRDGSSPRTIVEMLLLHIWEEEFGRQPLSVHDDFFDLGGDSLLGVRLLTRVEETFGKKLGLASVFEVPTVARMASLLSESATNGYDFGASKIIAIRSSGSLPPLFILGPNPLYRPLILNLPEDLPVFGLSSPDVARLPVPFRIEDIAAQQVTALRQFRPTGPYALLGWCADGVLAYEMAQQLRAQGQEVSLVVMIEGFNPARWKYESRWASYRERLRFHFANLAALDVKVATEYARERLRTVQLKTRRLLWRAMYRLHLRTDRRAGSSPRQSEQILSFAVSRYEPSPYDGRVLVVRAEARPTGSQADAAHGWRALVADLRVADVPGNHRDVFAAPNVPAMAAALAEALSSPAPLVNDEKDEKKGVTPTRQGATPSALKLVNPPR